MMNRREFMVGTSGFMMAMVADGDSKTGPSRFQGPAHRKKPADAKVAVVRTTDRMAGVKASIDLLGINPVKGRSVLLKPNFNTADSFPASTHNDTLISLIKHLKMMGAKSITIGERSGPPATSSVIKKKGIQEICRELEVKLINFEDLPEDQWVKVKPGMSHWNDGFSVAKPVLDAECIVSTCCLKTHGYGGVFTMSLKLSVGVTHKRDMTELHTSFRSMRKMIAEINQAYEPSLILLDGIEAFTDGGPSEGTLKHAGVMIAGTDRVAVDAVGISVLKLLGSNEDIMGKKIFEQEQISRAAELGLGISRPEDIELVAGDEAGDQYAQKLKAILIKG